MAFFEDTFSKLLDGATQLALAKEDTKQQESLLNTAPQTSNVQVKTASPTIDAPLREPVPLGGMLGSVDPKHIMVGVGVLFAGLIAYKAVK